MKEVAPGVGISLAAWMVLSLAFSYYVENFSNYSVLYGSIATVVVVLLWLYMSGTVLIMGAGIQRRDTAPQAQPAAGEQRRGASMKIIIVGNGKVGYAIARQLAVEDHDITIGG